MESVVILSETGELQLTSLSRHALFHAVSVLLPNQSMTAVLPKSGSMKVENFCNDLPQCILAKVRPKKISSTLSSPGELGNPLVKSLEIHKFLEHAISTTEFTESIEKQLLDLSGGEIDAEKLHQICWDVFQMEKGQDISIRHWFSPTCTYRLWLVFCCVQEQLLSETLSAKTTNEVVKRLGELCGYTWNETYSYVDTEELTFPQYLRAIATYFAKLQLEMSLTCEVIGDMVDEIVHGVLKKGFLIKKGHKRKSWKRRWFVLQRTIIRYYENRDNMILKGQLVLNSKTSVTSMPDKGKRKCLFEVTCGHTGRPFEISADDQRTKHDWMLAIKKAIALAKVIDGSSQQEDFTEHLSGFYLLKYGTPQPYLQRQDSTVRSMKYYATFREQRKRLSGKKKGSEDLSINDSGSSTDNSEVSTPQEDYLPMNPLNNREDNYSDDSSDSDSYTTMSPIKEIRSIDQGLSKSSEYLFDMPGDEGKNKDLEKGLSKSYSTSNQSSFRSVSSQDTNDSDDEPYDEANSMPRYTPNPRAHDKELAGYIDVTKISSSNKRSSHLMSPKKSLTDMTITEEDSEVSQMTARTLTLEPLPEADRAPSPHSYLTIVRGDNSPKEEPKKKEEVKRTKTIEPVLYKPAHKQHASIRTSTSLDYKSNTPPPVLPRPENHKCSPPSTLRNTPSHFTSNSYSASTGTRQYENTVPPLPPR